MDAYKSRCEVCFAKSDDKGIDSGVVQFELHGRELHCPMCGHTVKLSDVLHGAADAVAKHASKQMRQHIEEKKPGHIEMSYDATIIIVDSLRLAAEVLESHDYADGIMLN